MTLWGWGGGSSVTERVLGSDKNPASSEEGSRDPGKAAGGSAGSLHTAGPSWQPPPQGGKPLRLLGEGEGSRRDYEKTTQP